MKRTDQRGTVLVFALGTIVLLTTLGTSLLLRSLHDTQLGRWSSARQTAFFHTEAGIDRAIVELRQDSNWAGTGYTTVGSQGGYAVTISPINSRTKRVVSTGYQPSNVSTAPHYQQSQVEAIVYFQNTSFAYALFSATTVTLDSNALVDSYNSANGAYSDSNVSADGDVGSNATGAGTVTLNSNAKIKGDVAVGPGGNVTTDIVLNGNASFTGSPQTLIQAEDLSLTSFPSGSASGSLSLGSNEDLTLPGGTYRYTSVDLNSNASVSVTGNVIIYVENSFKLESNTQFVTTCPTCTMTLYVDGNAGDPNTPAVQLRSNALLSAGAKPSQLKVIITGNSSSTSRALHVESNSTIYGVIDAPRSHVDLDSNAKLFGAAVTRSIQLDSNAKVHYDVSLKSSGSSNQALQLRSWREL
ncbi:MAG: hypothetical protein HY599_02595 [Candidatus Omnitrophica bacterium]|nr:hypothetical protein [Candidatus Omnitrophota bacterium]